MIKYFTFGLFWYKFNIFPFTELNIEVYDCNVTKLEKVQVVWIIL